MPKILIDTINPVDFFCDPPVNKRFAIYNSVFKIKNLLKCKDIHIFGTIIEGGNYIYNFFMRIFFIFVIFHICSVVSLNAQRIVSPVNTGTVMQYKVENGDTVYYAHIKELIIRTPRKFKNSADERQFWRLVNNVKRVYPYAKLAGIKLHNMNEEYMKMTSERDKKAFSKKVENELKAEFEGELRKLTINQGRILMRLVDRETGNTTYEILKDFRGSASAVLWQTVAKVFGSNLKTTYDPTKGEDKIIERIILEIEEGWL